MLVRMHLGPFEVCGRTRTRYGASRKQGTGKGASYNMLRHAPLQPFYRTALHTQDILAGRAMDEPRAAVLAEVAVERVARGRRARVYRQ